MKITVAEAPQLKSAIDSVASIVEEGLFELKKEGIYLKAMDPSQISMISFSMPKESFVEYVLDEETKIGLDITQLSNVLSRAKRGEKAELSLEDGRLVIKFLADKRSKTFKIPLLDIGDALRKEPKIEFACHVKLQAEAFKDALKDAKLVSSHVRLGIADHSFVVDVKGDTGDAKAEYHKGTPELLDIVSSSDGARATFPLQYLEDIVKASTASSPITVHLKQDQPLKIEYTLEGAHVAYYLAPRIENE